jgi:hypothetical protein
MLTTHWRSFEAVVSVDAASGAIARVTPIDNASWLLLCMSSGTNGHDADPDSWPRLRAVVCNGHAGRACQLVRPA